MNNSKSAPVALLTTEATQQITWRNPHLRARIPELDGVRGLAILLVLIFHYIVLSFQPPRHTWQAYSLIPLQLTYTGVDLFFVLSGFLIGGILLDEKYAEGYYRTFYLRRIHRIFPLYFLWLATFVIGLYLVDPHATMASVDTNHTTPIHRLFNRNLPIWAYVLFVQNGVMTWRSTFGSEWIGISWSLAVEEQFYLLLPVIIRRVSIRTITRLVIVAVVAAPLLRIALWLAGRPEIGRYMLLPCRADSLGFGVLIALACRNERAWNWLVSHRRNIHAAFLVLAVGFVEFTLHPKTPAVSTVGYTLFAAFYASLILLVIVKPSQLERITFSNPALVRLGFLAYPLYLFHQGVNGVYYWVIRGQVPSVGWVTLLSLVTAIVLAELSWHWMEKPLIRRAHSRYKYGT